jgi:NADH-quinone oxidoreductase subunit N
MAGFDSRLLLFHFISGARMFMRAPTPVTAFLSVAPKAAGFAVLLRFFFSGMSHTSGSQWQSLAAQLADQRSEFQF